MGREERLLDNEAYRRSLRTGAGELVEAPRGVDWELHSFRCECQLEECDLRVELRLSEYDRLPNETGYFLVHPAHRNDEDEIVDDRGRYLIVKKG